MTDKKPSATVQILAGVQETKALMEQMKAEVAAMKEVLADHTQLLQNVDTKLDSARLASSAKGAGRGKAAGGSKKDSKPTAPPIHIWFRTQMKEDFEGTVAKFCNEDSMEAIKKSVAVNPASKNKKGDALSNAIAGSYYTKHFAKRAAPTYEEDGHAKLKKAHDELKASLEAGDGDADTDTDAVDADDKE